MDKVRLCYHFTVRAFKVLRFQFVNRTALGSGFGMFDACLRPLQSQLQERLKTVRRGLGQGFQTLFEEDPGEEK